MPQGDEMERSLARVIDPELDAYLADYARHWASLRPDAPIHERRIHGDNVAAAMALPAPAEVETSYREIPGENRSIPLRIDKVADASDAPCLVYIHGGGFSGGSTRTHADITMQLAATNRQTVVSVEYGLAPENQFPVALYECRDAAVWVYENAASLGIDSRLIAVGGDSAGATLAAGVTLLLRGQPAAPMAQILVYPCLHFDMGLESYRENAEAPLLPASALPAMIAAYCPSPADRRNPLAAPLHAPDLSGLPPAFIAVADVDPLRDDGSVYAERLRAAGVPVQFDDGEGLIHGYLRAIKYSSAARSRLRTMAAWLDAEYARCGCPPRTTVGAAPRPV